MTFHQIRWMIRRDIPRVAEIEADCFEFPWDEQSFRLALGQRNNIGVVVEVDNVLCGYMIYQLGKGYLHIANLAIAPEWQGHGLAMGMISYLQSKLHADRRTKITCEVRETNLRAQLFFKSMDFRAVSILRNLYIESDEQAYVMQYDLPARKPDAVANRIAKYMQA